MPQPLFYGPAPKHPRVHRPPVDIDIITISRRQHKFDVSDKTMERLLRYYYLLENVYSEVDSSFRNEIANTLLYALILEISGILKASKMLDSEVKRLRPDKLYDDFFILLSQYYKQERKVSFYADKLHVTPKYLSRTIKNITGKPILEWINEAIIIETKVQLKATEKTVLQISEELNFPNPSAFIQFFKLHTGTTPLAYRKS